MAETSSKHNWVVAKFGGTSVSSPKTWQVIVDHVRKLTAEGFKVCVVVSAVSQVTNHLERVLAGLEQETGGKGGSKKVEEGEESSETTEAIRWLYERHQRHCEELEVDLSTVTPFLEELQRLVDGIRLTGDAASFRLRGRVMTYGELMSSHVGHLVLQRELPELRVGLVDARQVLFSRRREDDSLGAQNDEDKFLNADVMPSSLDLDLAERLNQVVDADGDSFSSGAVDSRSSLFLERDVVITQGFIARTADGHPCVLGRGGSDTSGAHFAALLNARRYEIWTDVDGMFSADPRHVPGARLIEELSYREAQELAAMGAKVLHPRCLGPASWARVPVEIHNTMAKSERLTRIVAPESLDVTQESKVMAIAKRTGQVLLTISTVDMWGESGFLSRVFAPFEKLDISVDLIATSQYAVSMTLDYIPGGIHGEPFRLLLRSLQKQGNVNVEANCTVVSVVGRKLRAVLHCIADSFKELERYNVLLLSESTEDLNMSFVLAESVHSVDELVKNLHRVLLEGKESLGSTASGEAAQQEPKETEAQPSSPRKPRALSVSSPQLGPLRAAVNSAMSRAQMLDAVAWVEDELIKYANEPTPFAIIDLATVGLCAKRISTFSLTWSSDVAVIRSVYNSNPEITFICRSSQQVLNLCSIVGPSPRVHIPSAGQGRNSAAMWPATVHLVDSVNADDVAKASFVLSEARVVVTSITDLNEDTGIACVDSWFQPRNGQRIIMHSDLPSCIQRVKGLSVYDDALETLFSFDDNAAQKNSGDAAIKRMAISGIASVPMSSTSQMPIKDFIRFSM